jgi:UDP-N-acetylmuramoyl-tripeptide--D-alanyl-D-alanine ligase
MMAGARDTGAGQAAGDLLWGAVDAAAATGGRSRRDWRATTVTIDSRTLAAGELFIALEGPNRDGHGFVADALAKGAAAAVVTRRPNDVDEDAPLLLVDDTQAALDGLGRCGRARLQGKLVAVTGSVGKTSTKEMLRQVLGGFGSCQASRASYNNHWGVPLTLANLRPESAFAVAELGMNHAGEISALTRMARPHIAVITAIAPAHLANFADTSGIADAKCEIFEGLEPGGVAVINADTLHADRLRDAAARLAASVVSFGAGSTADIRLAALEPTADGSRATIEIAGRQLALRFAAPGRHWAMNSLAVLAVVQALGLDLDHAALRLAGVQPGAGRGATRAIGLGKRTIRLLDESYNANPASMAAALDVLGQQAGRRVAVLGDMLELGDTAPELHAGLVAAIEAAAVDQVLVAGPMMRHLHAALPAAMRGGWAEDSKSLAPIVLAALADGDVVLVKGSLGSAMRHVIEALDQAAAGNTPSPDASSRHSVVGG